MEEPEKPFACAMPDCGMTFTNEDHLHVHTKKHDMVLQFGCEQKAAFVADQTPTPTRFIRNCEEVGLFQDLQNVNPFDEGFKRAMETKQSIISLENDITTSTDDLHTPQMFPLIDHGDTVYTSNNQRNITISRSSSDESGAIKELETTTISKLTNEVTTISRIVEKHDDTPKSDDTRTESIRKDVFTNNVIKISNVEISRKDDKPAILEDIVIKEATTRDVFDRLQVDVPPIMSQKSIDYVVDSLTAEFCSERSKKDDYEVILKLPSGQQIKLTAAEEVKPKNTKDLLKKVLTEKVESQRNNEKNNIVNNDKNSTVIHNILPSVIPITTGTLIPVSIVNGNIVSKMPKMPLKVFDKKPIKRKSAERNDSSPNNNSGESAKNNSLTDNNNKATCSKGKLFNSDLDSRSAASRRYRAKLKETMLQQTLDNKQLKEVNDRLMAENAALKSAILDHMRRCHDVKDLRDMQEKLRQADTYLLED